MPDVPLGLGVLKNRSPLAREGGSSSCHFFYDGFLCGAILNLKAFYFGAIPDKMIELIVYGSVPHSGPK